MAVVELLVVRELSIHRQVGVVVQFVIQLDLNLVVVTCVEILRDTDQVAVFVVDSYEAALRKRRTVDDNRLTVRLLVVELDFSERNHLKHCQLAAVSRQKAVNVAANADCFGVECNRDGSLVVGVNSERLAVDDITVESELDRLICLELVGIRDSRSHRH